MSNQPLTREMARRDSLPGWLNTTQAAEYLGISPNTLKCWRSRDYGPAYHKLGKRIVRYCPFDLDAWASRRKTSSG